MPLFIIGAAVIGGAVVRNSRRRRAAEEAELLMQQQINERNGIIRDAENDLQQTLIDYEEGKLPIPKIDVEKGKFGSGLTEAVAAAKSRDDIEIALDQENVRLASAANVSDPRIRAAVMNKANKESRNYIDKVSNEVAKREVDALTNLGQAQTQVERDFANAKNEAEQQYAANAQQYFMSEVDRLNDILTSQGEAAMELDYQSGMVVPMAKAQNAADFTGAVEDVVSFGVTAEEGGVIKKEPTQASAGARIDYLDRFQEIFDSQGQGSALSGLTADQIAAFSAKRDRIMEERADRKEDRQEERERRRKDRAAIKAFEESEGIEEETSFNENDLDTLMDRARMARRGGITRGEFNHGDIDDPMSGNDQVLIDQEDLMRGLDSGEITSYKDIEDKGMIQLISTGGEGILDEDNFNDTNDLVDAANPNNPLRLDDLKLRDNISAERAMKDVLLAEKGKAIKGSGKKSQKEMDKAARLLAKYLSVVLSEPQFQE